MTDDLTREFLIESQEGLDRMERCLTDLEKKPDDSSLLAEIFRSVHTIKGTTGFLGFKRLEKLAHAGENLLGLLRDGKLSASSLVITGLLKLLDGLRSILRAIESDDNEGLGADDELIDLLAGLHASAQAPAKSVAVRKAQKSVRTHRASHSHVAQTVPLNSIAPSPHTSERTLPAEPPPVEGGQLPAAPSPLPEKEEEPTRRAPINGAVESTLRVDVVLLNRMMNLVGELVLTRNQVLQAAAADPNLTLLCRRLDMVTADLRESVMKARMQPVSNVFSKMPRMVRDLSQALNRRVRLVMEGQETELDKSLLEAIKDPLTHAVRNALDHGIETPQLRQAAGKDPEGILKLRAVHEGSHVIIEVSDDGAGIPVDKVRNKAIDRGLITPERGAQLTERELQQLVFLPGFSTASAVTNVSGRGVGMDVVRTNVEKIGGKVEVDSHFGKGTTLRLRIPLTLAIIPALIVRSVDQSFALPQGALSELVHVSVARAATIIEWIDDAPLYRLRGNLLPLVFLDRLLVPDGDHNRVATRDTFIAVLDAEGRRFGLVVDGLADPEEIVVKPLSAALKGIGLYSGATVLGSGDLALILDPGAIALKAGITLAAEQESANSDASSIETAGAVEFLLVDVNGCEAAVPLADVLRIEQLPASRIEYLGSRPVLNFEGQLLPVEDSGGMLTAAREDPSAQIVVVVCRVGVRQVGLVVSHVLDVVAGGDLIEAGTNHRTKDVVLLKNNVTSLVSFDCVTPLAVAEEEPREFATTV